jgi:hypothetical protein
VGLCQGAERLRPLLAAAQNCAVILEHEDAAGQATRSVHFWRLLSIASAATAAVVLVLVATIPREALVRAPAGTGPSILETALQRQAPARLALRLPAEVAAPLAPAGRSNLATRSYRLRGSNDIVNVAPVLDGGPVTAPNPRPNDALAVRGNYAQGWTHEPTSFSVVRWTENGFTYEISSRTLMPRDLARIAELLR